MGAVPYSLGQSDTISIAMPQPVVTIAGDNPTKFYLHFPNLAPAQQWVFPYTYGFCFPLPAWASSVNVTSRDTPPGFPVAPTDGTLASLIAYDYPLAYSAGVRLAEGSGWTSVGTVATTGAGQTFTTATVPPTTKALGIAVESATQGINTVGVVGHQSATVYLPPLTTTVAGWFSLPVNASLDQTFDITFTGTAGGFNVGVYATDFIPPFPGIGASASLASVPVAIATDQALGLYATSIVHQAAASTLIAATAGKTVRLFGCHVDVTTAVAGSVVQIQDTGGGALDEFSTAAVGNSSFDFAGGAVTTGLGVKSVLVGGAPTVGVTLTYSQG